MRQYKVQDYSINKEWNIISSGTNVSDIMSKMVTQAGRYCEHYASDIYYEMARLDKAVREGKRLDRVLIFYESGVLGKPVENDVVELDGISQEFIQYWRLWWNPDSEKGCFTRVELRMI